MVAERDRINNVLLVLVIVTLIVSVYSTTLTRTITPEILIPEDAVKKDDLSNLATKEDIAGLVTRDDLSNIVENTDIESILNDFSEIQETLDDIQETIDEIFISKIISIDEAVEHLERGVFSERKWKFKFEYHGEFESDYLMSSDGLVKGHLEWRASYGTLYEAEYPSGLIKDKIESLHECNDTGEYYVWKLRLKDQHEIWMDARNGELLLHGFPSRTPGLLTLGTAIDIAHAPKPKIKEWNVQDYKRLDQYEYWTKTFNDVKAAFLYRTSNGTLYEVMTPPPSSMYPPHKVLYIEVPEDKEAYNMWEITTENQIYYIDNDGVIRLIIARALVKPPVSPYLDEFKENPDGFLSRTLIHHINFIDESGSKLGNLTAIIEFKRKNTTVSSNLNFTFIGTRNVEKLMLRAAMFWVLVEAKKGQPTVIPLPSPDFYPVVLRNDQNVIFHSDSEMFKEEWNWTTIGGNSWVCCFNLTTSNRQNLYDYQPTNSFGIICLEDNTCWTMYPLWGANGDLLTFLHDNRVETVTEHITLVKQIE